MIFLSIFIIIKTFQQHKKGMNNEIHDDLQKIFKSFDINNSGTIELKELKKVAQALGESISQEDAQKIMKRLDTNGDGRISFQEFKYWWIKGFKGKLGRLVYLKARTAKFGKTVLKYLQAKKINTPSPPGIDYKNSCKFQVSFGQQIAGGLGLKFQLYHENDKGKTKISKLKEMIPNLNTEYLTLFTVLSCEKGTGSKQQLLQFLNKLKSQQIYEIQSIEENPFFNLSIIDYKDDKIIVKIQIKPDLIDLAKGQLQNAQNIYNNIVGQDKSLALNLQFKTNFTIEQLFNEKNLIQNLLKGFLFKFYLQLSGKVLAKIRQSFQNELAQNIENKSLSTLLLMLMKTLQFKIHLNSPEKVNNFFDKLGINDLLKQAPNLQQFLQPYSEDPIFGQIKNNPEHSLNLLYKIITFMKKYLFSGIEIGFCWKDTVGHLQLSYQGLFKIFNRIFNQV